MNAPRPAHVKAHIDGKLVYACYAHTDKLAAELQEPVHSQERNSASVWCHFCEKETE